MNLFISTPVFCPRCGREIESLACLACSMARLDDIAILANAKEIRAMGRWPVSKTNGPGNCLICAGYIAARTAAKVPSGRRICAHVECVRQLLARVDKVASRGESQPLAGDLPLAGVIEVK